MQDFKIKHVLGKKNVVADALSCYLKLEGQKLLKEAKEDLETFINNALLHTLTTEYLAKQPAAYLYNIRSYYYYALSTSQVLQDKYSNKSKVIA